MVSMSTSESDSSNSENLFAAVNLSPFRGAGRLDVDGHFATALDDSAGVDVSGGAGVTVPASGVVVTATGCCSGSWCC